MKDNQTYYFEVGAGVWRGEFGYRVTSWPELWRSGGLKDRLLASSMALMLRVGGPALIQSVIRAFPGRGPAGVATNVVRISKLGVTLYLLRETYTLDPNGTDVDVSADERFGPIPGILRRRFTYPAEIHTAGMSSTYHMPLLGSAWTASYAVRPDRRHLDGTLVCGWAEATETIARMGGARA